MKNKQQKRSMKRQSGAVLVLGLTLIMILSVLIISSAKTTVHQQKMSANLRDKELAFQSAESGLMTGETYLSTAQQEDLAGDFSDSGGLYLFDNARSLSDAQDWTGLDSKEAPTLHQVIGNPEYIIEELPNIEADGDSLIIPRPVTSQYYRVTSKAKGGTEASLSVHQTMYKK